MSKNQWIVLGALAVAVALTFASLGGYLLTYLASHGVSLNSTAIQSTHMATEAPAGTPTSLTSASTADYGYRLCFQDVTAASIELVQDLGIASSMRNEDPAAFCEVAATLDLQSRAAELKASHQNCPVPTDSDLLAARDYLDSALDENVEAAELIDHYCGGDSGTDWLAEATAHAERGSELTSLAEQEMQAYYASY